MTKMQLDIFDVTYPLKPGHKRRDTSKAAATFVGKVYGQNLRDKVYEALKVAPGSTDEIAERLEATVLSIRPRFSELVKMGKIEDSGRRHVNESGRAAIIWHVIP